MIIDIDQKDTCVSVSYTNENKGISITDIPLPPEGYTNWELCNEDDPFKHPTLRNYDGKSVKKVPGRRFYDLNLHEFLQVGADETNRQLIHSMNKPNFFSVDIETEITDDANPDAETAPNRILSISITAPNMATIIGSLREVDMTKVIEIVRENMGEYSKKYNFDTQHIVFANEKDLLEWFIQNMKDVFHVIGGWFFLGYDWLYIKNRCKKLGIRVQNASPVGKLDFEGIPMHRLIFDYQEMYKEKASADVISFALNEVSDYELGIGKLDYDFTLKELYEQDPEKFIAYAIIDTLLVQLIHKKRNIIDIQYNMAYYTKISVKRAGKNIALADSLIFREFWNRGNIYGDPQKEVKKQDYPGAFVKDPVKHEIDFPAGVDAKSLYPSSGITMRVSPDAFAGTCKDSDIPILRKNGFIVTHNNNVYKRDKEYLFTKIWKGLRTERDLYKKDCMMVIYLQYLPAIEAEAEKRGIKLKSINDHH